MEFSSDEKIRAIRPLTDALFEHVLYDEEPIFVSDEATIFDVSLASPEELQKRCSIYYNTAVSLDDLRRPLWELLPELDRRRRASVE
jgi:hypothetical protein